MKKAIFILIILAITAGLVVPSFAKDMKGSKAKANVEIIKGSIVSIDTQRNEIVVKDEKTNTDKTVVADPKMISTLKTGEMVKVKIKTGDNKAVEVIKVVSKHKR